MMLKHSNHKIVNYSSLLILILLCSCNKKEKTNSESVFDHEIIAAESAISFKNVDYLNETNKKVIDIASIAFYNSRELNKSKIILKIKKDHQRIQNELKKITDENLIIIPEPIYDLNLNQNFLKGISSSYYLISLLDKEIKNQIQVLDTIEKNSKNNDFKNFAQETKELLKINNELLEELL